MMKSFLSIALLGCLYGSAQTPTPQWRPVYHFTPERNWTNDPNGLLYLDGVYHLYNQQNPFANVWGHMSWGHATSTDLIHWKHLPVALPEGADTTERFSGCAVFDTHNTSGFCKGGKGCIVAIYTADQPNRKRESQYVAYSNDDGMTFTDYSGDPVIDLHRKDFRDPNVSWNDQLQQWLMVVSMVDEHKVRFYASPDLKSWSLLSEFGPYGYTGQAWECPAFFHLPVQGEPGVWKWVLAVSSGGPHGGPFIQYFIGDFDGKTFTAGQAPTLVRPVDYGNTFYAAIPWNGEPEDKRTYIGWLVPEPRATYPWRGAMSIPRDLSLREEGEEIVLCQQPSALIEGTLRTMTQKHFQYSGTPLGDGTAIGPEMYVGLGDWAGNAYWIKARFRLNTAGTVGLRLVGDQARGRSVVISYDKTKGAVLVDRSRSDTAGLDADKLVQSIPVKPGADEISLEVLMDKSILEVFVNGGEQVLTTWVFPTKGQGRVWVFSDGGTSTIADLEGWNLENVP